MAICAKCGQEVGIANLLSHPCSPRQLSQEERKQANDEARLKAQQQAMHEREIRELNREIALADQRDFGPGQEQVDRFGDSARKEKRWNPETKTWDEYTLDHTGSALKAEAQAGGTPSFDPEDEVPKDPHDRAQFIAREMRFPNEQIKANGDFQGGNQTRVVMNEAERAEFARTSKVPESALQRMTPVDKLEQFKAARKEAAEPREESLDLELGIG